MTKKDANISEKNLKDIESHCLIFHLYIQNVKNSCQWQYAG